MLEQMKERNFEDDICAWLCTHGGYRPGDPARFDRTRALDVQTLLDFVRTSQPKAWKMHQFKNPGKAEQSFVDRFCEEVRRRSLLDVLRYGFSVLGTRFRVVFWKPETGLNPESVRRYQSNILHCTRQLRYSPAHENSVDVALLLNGIPVICLELKNPFTGQTVEDAVRQFRQDRSPDDLFFSFKRRVLTCFAVDPFHVKMTTRLERQKTFFLPFDQGGNGAGEVGGAGNPPAPDGGYPTAYLWQRVLCRDALLELLHKFLHLEKTEKKDPATGKVTVRERLIFPRYHQWDMLHKLLDDIRAHGPGQQYLIQHSAGSGKSNSIAWLAHRLSGLHDAQEGKIFQSVIVVTDRRVLDRQLRDTILQFEQTDGLVRAISKDSAQLRDAINEGAAIIVTTLQKFPVIFREVRHGQRNFAVIVDEAHSSQTGRAALTLKTALADTDAALAEYAALEDEAEAGQDKKDDALWQELAAQGRHHTSAAARAAMRFESLHPHNIAQKTAVMLDHFRTVTARKMGGRAKAMLVAPSRLHAVRYMQEFTRQIREGRINGVRALVAFSGEVRDTVDGVAVTYTEEGLNKETHGFRISEKELPAHFAGEFNILIVAEKYQTGFDEPLLHTMFVDKQLSGVKAVQTLSRLNRTAPGKEDTFVLDFVNSAEDMQKSFAAFYEATLLEEETDPNLVYDIRHRLDDFRVYGPEQVEAFGKALRDPRAKDGQSALAGATATLAPVPARVAALEEEDRRAFRTGLFRFVRLYNFITQICRMFDEEMHIYSLFAKQLAAALPAENDGLVNLDGQIDLEYYKLVKTGEASIPLTPSEKGYAAIKGDAGAPAQKEFDSLSSIVEKINQRFGTQFNAGDQVENFRALQKHVLASDARIVGLADKDNRATWEMVYDTAFMAGAGETAMHSAAFLDLIRNPDTLAFIRTLLKESIWQEALEKRREKETCL